MVIIANPIFDVVFKRVMENELAARFIIGTLLDLTVVSVSVQPQEYTRLVDDREGIGVTVFRLDFIATIKTDEGELINILIEIQKVRSDTDLMRFRNYVAEQYKRQNMVEGKKKALPIITIYILGYDLPELPLAFTAIKRQYRDGITKTPVAYKSDFVESLTHDTYVLQVGRITGRHQTRIEKVLSLFEQTDFVDGDVITKYYKHPTDLEGIKVITDILHEMGSDPLERKDIQEEKEAWRTIYGYNGEKMEELVKTLEEKDKVIGEKDKALDESKKEIDESKKALDESKKVIDEKDKALDESMKVIDEKDKALDESMKVIDESKKVIDEKDKALDESMKVIDESKKVIDEKDKVIDEKDKANAEMARQLEELKRRLGEK